MRKHQLRIDQHRVFLIEKRGDTLIVSPKGDPAGFGNVNVNMEHASLLSLLKDDKHKNMLVDLSGSNYFGAKILGAITEWANIVKSRGGKFAVCGLSSDMKEMLRIFQIDERWQQFDTREKGVKAIVSESPLAKVRHHKKQLGWVCLAILVGGLAFLPWGRYYAGWLNKRDYNTVLAVWNDMQALKAVNAHPSEWRKLEIRARREIEPILPGLDRRAGTESPQAHTAQQLYMAVDYYIFAHLLVDTDQMETDGPVGPAKEKHWQTVAVHMEMAEWYLNGGESAHPFSQINQHVKSVADLATEETTRFDAGHGEPNTVTGGPNAGHGEPNTKVVLPIVGNGENPPHVRPAVAEAPNRDLDSHDEPQVPGTTDDLTPRSSHQ